MSLNVKHWTFRTENVNLVVKDTSNRSAGTPHQWCFPGSLGVSGLAASCTLAQVTQPGLIRPWLVSQQHYSTDHPSLSTATWRLFLLLLLQPWGLFSSSAYSCPAGYRLCRESGQQSPCSLLLLDGNMPASLVSGTPPQDPGTWQPSFQLPPPCGLPRAWSVLSGQVVQGPLTKWQCLVTEMSLQCVELELSAQIDHQLPVLCGGEQTSSCLSCSAALTNDMYFLGGPWCLLCVTAEYTLSANAFSTWSCCQRQQPWFMDIVY